MSGNVRDPLVSVVVPVYNVEKYLRRCLDSIIGQTYQNLEIIIVDDGSTDGSSEVAQEYARKDRRVRVIRQENKGLSSARNSGIKQATGRYVTLIDSDDWVDVKYIEFLLTDAEKYGCEIVTCGEYLAYENGVLFPEKSETNERYLETSEEALEDMLYQRKLNNSAWGKLYAKRLFNDILYPEGKWYEDIGTTYKLLLACKTKTVVNSRRLYYYRQRKDGISKRGFDKKTMDIVEMVETMAKDVKLRCPKLTAAANSRCLNAYFFVLRQLDREKNMREYKELITKIKALRMSVLKDPSVRMKTKGGIILSYMSFRLIPILFGMFDRTKMIRSLE